MPTPPRRWETTHEDLEEMIRKEFDEVNKRLDEIERRLGRKP